MGAASWRMVNNERVLGSHHRQGNRRVHVLSVGTSAQKAELIALTRALELSQGKILTSKLTLNMFSWRPCSWGNMERKRALNLGE